MNFRVLFLTPLLVAAAASPVHKRLQHPPIKHVFVLILENESAPVTFGQSSPAPYLADSLVAQGAFLPNYYGIGHASLDNYIAMISGQAPNEATQLDCGRYTDFHLTQPTLNENGQALGTGCVYPNIVKTIANQLDEAHISWKAYMEDMGNDPAKEATVCGHPAIGQQDGTLRAEPKDQYATKHNPFFYFHSIIDNPTTCGHVVNLDSLKHDLGSIATTPQYAFITPNLCDDGHDAPCVNFSPGGLTQADHFLAQWVPLIVHSPAFQKDGMLIITFDEGGAFRNSEDTSACCGEQPLPGQPHPPGYGGPGGGRTGAVVISPFIKPGTVSDKPYNHYAMLRTVEDIFGLSHLGYAGGKGPQSFGADVFTKP